jgi:hypothetical protein
VRSTEASPFKQGDMKPVNAGGFIPTNHIRNALQQADKKRAEVGRVERS